MQPSIFDTRPAFDGPELTPEDTVRLSAHLLKLTKLMADGRYRTLKEIAEHVGCTESAAGSRLRDLRKEKFGSFSVDKKNLGGGLWVYRVDVRSGRVAV